MPHASLCVPLRSVRDARLIHMSTTASGWRKHSRSSTSFFITLPYPGRRPGIAPAAPRPAPRRYASYYDIWVAAPGNRSQRHVRGQLSVVEPILVLELPATLILASRVF